MSTATTRRQRQAAATSNSERVNFSPSAKEWERVLDRLQHPAVELDCETFSEFLQMFRRRQAAGARIERGFVVLVNVLVRQLKDTYMDSDSDGADRLLDLDDAADWERDDPNEDGGDDDSIGGNLGERD